MRQGFSLPNSRSALEILRDHDPWLEMTHTIVGLSETPLEPEIAISHVSYPPACHPGTEKAVSLSAYLLA